MSTIVSRNDGEENTPVWSKIDLFRQVAIPHENKTAATNPVFNNICQHNLIT